MECDRTEARIQAVLDGEGPDPELEAHLEGCDECRALREELEAQHAELEGLLGEGSDAWVEGMVRRSVEAVEDEPRPDRRPARVASWLAPLAAAAAGFVLALLVGPLGWPGRSGPPDSPEGSAGGPVARVLRTTGPLEADPADGEPRRLGPDDPVPADARLVSGEGRAAVLLADGSEVRLDTGTRLAIDGPRRLALERGRVSCRVRSSLGPDDGFEVATPDGVAEATGTTIDVSHDPEADRSTELWVVEGTARLGTEPGASVDVPANHVAWIADGRPAARAREAARVVLATRWVHELLLARGRDDPEVLERVDGLLSGLGRAKMAHLYAEEIRALGPACALPLARWLRSEASRTEPALRRRAAEILAEVAEPRDVPELIALLADDDGAVRSRVAEGLVRLSGVDPTTSAEFACSPGDWQTASADVRSREQTAWQGWWEDHRAEVLGE